MTTEMKLKGQITTKRSNKSDLYVPCRQNISSLGVAVAIPLLINRTTCNICRNVQCRWNEKPTALKLVVKRETGKQLLVMAYARGCCTRRKSHTSAMIIGCLRLACATQIGDILILPRNQAHFTQPRTKKYATTKKPHDMLTATVTISVVVFSTFHDFKLDVKSTTTILETPRTQEFGSSRILLFHFRL